MKKVVLISFFNSKNLGDLALSNTLENLLISNRNIVKYDFLTVEKMLNFTQEKLFDMDINSKGVSTNKEKKIRKIRGIIKMIINNTLGVMNTAIIRYKVLKLVDRKKWCKIEADIRECDMVIIGGGNMIMDINPNWADLFYDYVSLAKKYNKRVDVIYVGVGPILHERSKRIYEKSFNMVNNISVRDKISKTICQSLVNNKDIIESVDPAFLIPIDAYRARIERIEKSNKIYKLGISVLGEMCFKDKISHETYLKGLYDLFNNYIKKIDIEKEIVLFSTEIGDYKAIKKFYDIITDNSEDRIKIVYVNKVNEISELYKELDFLIGGRMHGLIFAQKCLLPFVGIVWQNKVIGFAEATNNLDRIFKIEDIEGNNIVEIINKDIRSTETIEKMNKKNKELAEIVIKGMSS